jgi:hypothetical protein
MRRTLPFALSLLLAAGACGTAEVVVTLEIDLPNPDGEGTITQVLADVEVQLVPYDRDAVFDSISAAYGTPEPAVPQELIDRRDAVQTANEEWQATSRRWQTIRDTLVSLNTALEEYSRGESRYVALFREWTDFDGQLGSVERQRDAAFDRFVELQEGTIRSSDSIAMLRDAWGDEAFIDVGVALDAMEAASGLDLVTDTTDASGVARQNFRVPAGVYWVHARYELAYTELYWNVRIQAVKGEPLTIVLNRANAQERIKL